MRKELLFDKEEREIIISTLKNRIEIGKIFSKDLRLYEAIITLVKMDVPQKYTTRQLANIEGCANEFIDNKEKEDACEIEHYKYVCCRIHDKCGYGNKKKRR